MGDSYELASAVDRFMRQIEAGVHVRAQVMDADRVGPFGGMVLLTLADLQPVPVQGLVARLNRDKSQMTRVLQGLGGKGMIDRQSCPTDGRVTLLRLSEKGEIFVEEIRKIMSEVMDDVLAPLSEAEREGLAGMLAKLGRDTQG